METKTLREQVHEAISISRIKDVLGEPEVRNRLNSSELFVELFWSKNNIQIKPSGIIYINNIPTSKQSLEQKLVIEYDKEFRAFSDFQKSKLKEHRSALQKIDKHVLKAAFDLLFDKKHRDSFLNIINPFSCEKEDLYPLKKFIAAISSKEQELSVAVFAHFLWSVKRKMAGKSVVHHICPVLYGPQGAGKSYVLNRYLLKPLEEFRINLSVADLSDERKNKALSQYFIGQIEELAGAKKAEIEAVKNKMTADFIDWRPFFTQESVSAPQRCSFIASSNKPISEMIKDETGNRRFYELSFNQADKIDRLSLAEIDYLGLWKGIDENKEGGYLIPEVLSELNTTQQNYYIRDSFSQFCEEFNIVNRGSDFNNQRINHNQLFEIFKNFERDNNERYTLKKSEFDNKMANSGFVKKVVFENGVTWRAWIINDGAEVVQKGRMLKPVDWD